MTMHRKSTLLLISSIFWLNTTHTDPVLPHYFVATPYYTLKSRTERKGLFTIDLYGVYGVTSTGRNANNVKTNILQMYGLQKMRMVGKNVDLAPFSPANAAILTNLWHVAQSNPLYATLEFNGRVAYKEGEIRAGFNITDNIFIACIVPFSHIAITNTTYVDTTPSDVSDAAWTNFLANFNSILTQTGLTFGESSNGGIDDIVLYTGWTKNLDDFQSLYFLDFTISIGASLGTAPARNEDQLFSIARGYNRHKGFVTAFDLAFSPIENLTFGAGLSNVYLFKRTQSTRLQSAPGQNGFVKLSKTDATCEPGSVYRIGGYLTYDYHILGITVAYSYVRQTPQSTFSTPTPALFPPDVINTDSMFASWSQQVLGFALTADWAADNPNKITFPRGSIFYNYIIKGDQTFLTNTVGGNLGVALTLDF